MLELPHPSTLNALQRFRQANALFKRTSRARNAAWYKGALELDFQLHIRVDGSSVSPFLYDRQQDLWSFGPPLTEQTLLEEESLTAYVNEAIKHVKSSGATALGVILHIADEFSLTEINPELTDRDSYPSLREAAINDPLSILADSSAAVDQSSWRILPYFDSTSESIGTAVTLSRRFGPTLEAIRNLGHKQDFPVITHALSAPLVALLGVPNAVNRTDGKPSVIILQYPFFTVLAFFNERSDLMLVRTQLHRGLRRPPNFGNAVATTSASLEFVDPDIFVFPLGKDVDPTLAADLAATFPGHHVQLVTPPASSLPPWCAECVISTHTPLPDEGLPATYHLLREDKWSFQDFLPASKETRETLPSRAEMRLLSSFRIARFAALAIGLLVIGWFAYGILSIVRSPEWAFDPTQAAATKKRLAILNIEKQKVDHWDSLLEDRSKAWSAMESLTRLFPENSGVLVKDFSASARPDTSPGQGKVGFSKEWRITGFVRDEARELLNNLNTRERISAHFAEIAEITGNSAFDTTPNTRSIVVDIRTQENSSFKRSGIAPDVIQANGHEESTYPYTFDLSITQRFESTDPLAIIATKAP